MHIILSVYFFQITLSCWMSSYWLDTFEGIFCTMWLLQETACRLVKSIGDDKILLRVKSEGLPFARKSKTSKKTVKDLNFNINKENDPCYTQCNTGEFKTAIWLAIVDFDQWYHLMCLIKSTTNDFTSFMPKIIFQFLLSLNMCVFRIYSSFNIKFVFSVSNRDLTLTFLDLNLLW